MCLPGCTNCSNGTLCNGCLRGYLLSPDFTTCTAICPDGEYYTSTSTCAPCSSTCRTCTNATACVTCLIGKGLLLPTTNPGVCYCPGGVFLNTTT